jgi:hypothetical protein
LRMHLIDSLYNLDQAAVSSRLKVSSLWWHWRSSIKMVCQTIKQSIWDFELY